MRHACTASQRACIVSREVRQSPAAHLGEETRAQRMEARAKIELLHSPERATQ